MWQRDSIPTISVSKPEHSLCIFIKWFEALKNKDFFAKKFKKMLDKRNEIWYSMQARLRDTEERAGRTLKTIQTERETRKGRKTAIPKSEEQSVERRKALKD